MARADFLERTRGYAFLVTLCLVIFLGYSVNNGQIILRLDDYRGVFNSAWVGSMMSLVITTFLSLFGFYVVKNSIERDQRTGVGQIMATTPLTRTQYVVGKWLSNFAVLGVLVGILCVGSVIMQLLYREVPQIDLWALLAPMLFISLPMMALCAALAVVFETVPLLRGGFGNLVYFFLWTFGIVASVEWIGKRWPEFDPMGIYVFMPSMSETVKVVNPAYQNGFILGVGPTSVMKTFLWPGLDWTPALIAMRLLWVLIAFVFVLISALFFTRFDPTRERLGKRKPNPAPEELTKPSGEISRQLTQPQLTPLSGMARFNFGRRLLAELRLMLKGQKWWWYLAAAGLMIAPLAMPAADAPKVLLAAWVWPVLVWSGMGCREARHQTGQIVFSTARPVASQLPVTWLAGLLVTLLMGLGAGTRLLIAGDQAGLMALLGGAVFIPSLALALGVWTGGSKAFEIVYLLLWYIGPLNQTPGLDYMGIGAENLAARFSLLALGLAVAALLGRRRQIFT
jgi:ABC-type transport system involved in multi-copper enzyme maturation permease subunit